MRAPAALLLPGLLLAGCATDPTAPTLAVMPAPHKPFEVFVQDQNACKAYAYQQTAGAADRANQRAVGAAVIGTALGAALGAIADGGHGAGIGAGFGAAAGTMVGAGTSADAGLTLQDQYDTAYAQCMYAKGNQVPGYQYQNVGTPPPPPPPPGWRRYG